MYTYYIIYIIYKLQYIKVKLVILLGTKLKLLGHTWGLVGAKSYLGHTRGAPFCVNFSSSKRVVANASKADMAALQNGILQLRNVTL